MTGGRPGIPNPTPIPDTTPSTSTITSLTEGAIVLIGKPVTITGTASDAGGGTVVRVEVSVDGGTTFSPATGTNAWSFNWTPSALGPVTIKSRAVDNTGNVQNPPVEIHVTVNAPPTSTITFPISGATVLTGVTTYITGTASDTGGGSVARVEVSVDGGTTFSAAMGANAWSFNWTPTTPGQATIRSRAADNNGSAQDPTAEITVTVRTPITIRVPSDQPTIQAAINVADYGDTVMVAPGTYAENINFNGKAITVKSESGPQNTIIDGGKLGSVVTFTSGEGRDSILNGFTLQNGSAGVGGGIIIAGSSIAGSSPTITNNVITNNHACLGGGAGIWINFGSPLIQLNTITNNGDDISCPGKGGGIQVNGNSSVEILDNVISNNKVALESFGGGGIDMGPNNDGIPIIKGNVIKGNGSSTVGGGILLASPNAVVVQNLITGNHAERGGGIFLVPISQRLVNNTIADNVAASGSGIYSSFIDTVPPQPTNNLTELTNNIIVAIQAQSQGQSVLHCLNSNSIPSVIRFNNIFSANGFTFGGAIPDQTGMNGNISADPMFANPTQGDYHLLTVSPSIDSGDNMAPNLPDTDIDGDPRIMDGDGNGTAIVDMGVYEFPAQNSTREIRFSKITLDREFRSEGVAVADINRDGRMDVVAGNLWYEAPAWTPHEIQPVKQFDAANGYSNSFINFAADINNDGWPDQIRIDFPGSHRVVWNENPKGQNQHWVEHTLFRNACNESPAFATIHGAGKNPSLVFSFDDEQMAWYEPARVAGAEFMAHPISVQFTKEQAIDGGVFRHSHGLGVGDVNGDGRNDVIIRAGYWEAPADPRQPNWKFVAANLGEGCAQMHVYDVNGDGRKDVISSSAHGIGVWLHERLPDGKFVTRLIDDSFSQSHSLELADINGDGLKDIVTGKRFWAHGPTGDVNPGDPAVVVWFELRREGRQVRWIKHEIDNDSGVGTQFVVADVNHDKLPDIVTSNKKGVFVFLQHQ